MNPTSKKMCPTRKSTDLGVKVFCFKKLNYYIKKNCKGIQVTYVTIKFTICHFSLSNSNPISYGHCHKTINIKIKIVCGDVTLIN